MKTTRLARRLGLDGNPLRRSTDKIATCLAALLLVMFLAGAPWLSVAAVSWTARAAAAAQQAARSWRQVPAVLRQAAPASTCGGIFGYCWVLARWTAPHGQGRTGEILVKAGLGAGSSVPVWVNRVGWLTGPPPSHRAVRASEAAAPVFVVLVLGIVLLCLAGAGRWALDRRRLANWEAAWAAVGPEWTRRFRSRG